MEYTLRFVIDDYDPPARDKKNVKINRRNRDEIMQGYTDTRYSWSIKKYMGQFEPDGWFRQGADQKTGKLEAGGVAHELNTDYCFDFDYEPAKNDLLSILYHYCRDHITGRARPYFFSGEILLVYNGKEWERYNQFFNIHEEIYRGMLHITPK